MIAIRNLKKSYGAVPVLTDINLSINQGEIYGLIGRSGAGKSTLLRCLNGLESYDQGSLMVDGVEVSSLQGRNMREFRRQIGMIFQQFSLLSRMSVYQNIALPMHCWKYKPSEIDRKVRELADLVGITDKLHTRPGELSGGQKQRVAIARALSMNPKILLCDEATSALDPQTAKAIMSLLNRINSDLGITIVVVTHQMSVVRSSCHRISILEHGRIADSGNVEEVFLCRPQSLRNLMGASETMLPRSGANPRILLSRQTAREPIITRMARELQIDCLILGGEMEQYRDSVLGSLLINLPYQHLPAITRYLDEHQVAWRLTDQAEAAGQAPGGNGRV